MRSHERHLYSQATETNNNAVHCDIQQLMVMTDERIRGEIALKLNFVLFLQKALSFSSKTKKA